MPIDAGQFVKGDFSVQVGQNPAVIAKAVQRPPTSKIDKSLQLPPLHFQKLHPWMTFPAGPNFRHPACAVPAPVFLAGHKACSSMSLALWVHRTATKSASPNRRQGKEPLPCHKSDAPIP